MNLDQIDGSVDMAKAPKKEPSLEDIELVPDAWPRFEKFIKEIAKAPPKHKTSEDKPKTTKRAKPK